MEPQQCEEENPVGTSCALLHGAENGEEWKKKAKPTDNSELPEGAEKPQNEETMVAVEVDHHKYSHLPSSSQAESEINQTNTALMPTEQKPKKKRTKTFIFVSYPPDSDFLERKFVCETVRQLKENNLSEDIWFDKDEVNLFSALWLSQRLEAVEKCRAAIIFLSDAYFACPVSFLESKILYERSNCSEKPPKVFPILFTPVDIPKSLCALFRGAIDLTGVKLMKTSLAEKCSLVIGNLSAEIDKYSLSRTTFQFNPPCMAEMKGDFRRKSLVTWRVEDVQEWLAHLGIREFYQQTFAECAVDGYLLSSLTDESLSQCLGVESRTIRRKVLNQRAIILEHEQKNKENWHLRSQAVRTRPNSVYLIYDPADIYQAEKIMMDLKIKGFQVLACTKLGQSKEEFLQTASPLVGAAKKVVVLLTDSAAGSPIVYQLILFCELMRKSTVITMFKSCWHKLRPILKAILGDKPTVDCEGQTFRDAMSTLELQLSPPVRVHGVRLEQAYLDRISEGVMPLKIRVASPTALYSWPLDSTELEPKVFISYQWDMQAKVLEIQKYLEANGLPCWTDLSVRGKSRMNSRSSSSFPVTPSKDFQSTIQRSMKVAYVVVSCITLKYIQSDNCHKDLQLAEALRKPVIPILLHFLHWPPEGTPHIPKLLCHSSPIDLSNDRIFCRNIGLLVSKIKQLTKC